MGRQSQKLTHTQPNLVDDALVFDRLRFETNTMFDLALQREILGLFQLQIEQTHMRLSKGAVTSDDAKFLGHTLRGAAAAVGARELEDIGANWEKLSSAGHDLAAIIELAKQRFKRATANYTL